MLIEINANRDAKSVEQKFYRVPESEKPVFLRDLIVDNRHEQVLVFTRQKRSAAMLADHLKKDGFTVEALHGDKTQAARLRILEAFKKGELRVLVATDLASRGLDIKELPVVVNYELPQDPTDYIHRIGRTGRAGAKGLAYSLVSEKDSYKLQDIEKLLKKRISVEVPVRYEEYFAGFQGDFPKQKDRPHRKRDNDKNKKAANSERKRQKAKSAEAEESFDYMMSGF